MGTPARLRAWVCTCGHPLANTGDDLPDTCAHCGRAAYDGARA
jgi:hypothetical protein